MKEIKLENKLEITGEIVKIDRATSKNQNVYYRGVIGSYTDKTPEGKRKNYIGFNFWVFDKNIVDNMDNLRLSNGSIAFMEGNLMQDSYNGNTIQKFIIKKVNRVENNTESAPIPKPKHENKYINNDLDSDNPFL